MKTEKIHVGKLVELAFNQGNLSKAAFSKSLGILPQNLNREFENEDWSVIKLIRAGKSLKYDFSPLFSIDEPTKEIKTPKVMLQVEIEQDKINEVLKYIEDKELYKILKR